MIRARIIPCLLLHGGGLCKTTQFKNPRYIGDPINAVRILNDKEVDELILLDIDASVENRDPDYRLIEDIVSEAFMPVCYGGGIKSIDQIKKLFFLGVEKISLSSKAVESPEFVSKAAELFGNQSVVVSLDVAQVGLLRKYEVVLYNGKVRTGLDPVTTAIQMASRGAGEILINVVGNDGVMKGYETDLVEKIASVTNIPVIALGGAGNLEDMRKVIVNAGASSAAAGSIFVYYGKLKAVLINYPSQKELKSLFDIGVAK